MDAAKQIVRILLDVARRRKPNDRPKESLPFELEGVLLYLSFDMVQQIHAAAQTFAPDPAYVERRLSEVTKEVSGRSWMTEEIFQSLDPAQELRVYSVCAMALAIGITRWPQTLDGPPEGPTRH